MGIYKIATSFCICRGCEKGVGTLSLSLGFSSETVVSTSQRHTCCVFVRKSVSPLSDQHRLLVVHDLMCVFFPLSLFVQPVESPFVNGKITHKITVMPSANLTVSCTVTNEFGMDTRPINVSSRKYQVVMWSTRA